MSQQYWVTIPLVQPMRSQNSDLGITDGWNAWDSLRHMTGHHHRLSVVLEVGEDVPSDPRVLQRWAAEPVKAVLLPTSLFLTNKKGFPVLSKKHQNALAVLLRFKIQIIFSGRPRHADLFASYAEYIQHLRSRAASELTEGERFTQSYKDTLQSPLQPLMDNLEGQTYETFERDATKYIQYERAVASALEEYRTNCLRNAEHEGMLPQQRYVLPTAHPMPPSPPGLPQPQSPPASTCEDETHIDVDIGDLDELGESVAKKHFNRTAVVMVVGAGRGPLVAAALGASLSTGVPIRVFAVEKNENAVITLRNRVMSERWNNVTIVSCDMRTWQPPDGQLADLLVSELLGSWGDNELSPECLDGAQRFLKPVTGVSIPCDYSSFLAPVSCSKLWMGARDIDLMGGAGCGGTGRPGTKATSLDMPYVVKFHNVFQIADPLPVFRFEHPNWGVDAGNAATAGGLLPPDNSR
jgi:type II protein arginine methyltransferase